MKRRSQKWARQKTYCQHLRARRKSKLDPYKPIIQRWLGQHPYSAAQIFQRLRAEQACSGGISILTDYVRRVRPVRAPAFLTLVFAPSECAQVDWGSAGSMAIGSTRRRLSFFVMVLCYSRMCYVEFTLGEATEHFLAAHQNALEFFGGVPDKILIDFVPRNKIGVMYPATLCGLDLGIRYLAQFAQPIQRCETQPK
jgi:transposase